LLCAGRVRVAAIAMVTVCLHASVYGASVPGTGH
jgi:hypothetical protein